MNDYIARVLGDGVTPATRSRWNAARTGYWRRYGATMLGWSSTITWRPIFCTRRIIWTAAQHDPRRTGLRQLLRRLPGRKILLTNAPHRYSTKVLRHLGLQRQFSHHVAVEAMTVHGKMRPKPSRLLLQPDAAPAAAPGRCMLVEDTLANLRTAHQLGMRTAWVTQYLTRRHGRHGASCKNA
jgi:putative hydrolase of the HAD superfamily